MGMRIIVDAMGGDKAPGEIVSGAVLAGRELGVDVTLVGREEDVRACLKTAGAEEDGEHIRVVHASELITMDDDPSTAVRRKKNSSMTVALNLLRDGEGDACVSAGSTGALLTGATLIVKRIRGVRRACLAPVLPLGERGLMIIDCGANVECTPEYLLQFACMGSLYCRDILGMQEPRVGLLNNGTEPTKGTDLQKQAYYLLQAAQEEGRLRFIGNIEAGGIFSAGVDVVVCDGFTGNILLKSIEGTVAHMIGMLKESFRRNAGTKAAALLMRGELKALKQHLNVSEIGGTPLLGISRPVIKAHGSSDAYALRSAIRQAVQFIDAEVIAGITRSTEYMNISKQ